MIGKLKGLIDSYGEDYVILDVGGKKVANPVDVRNAIAEAKKDGKRSVLMRLKSDDATRFVAIPIARA